MVCSKFTLSIDDMKKLPVYIFEGMYDRLINIGRTALCGSGQDYAPIIAMWEELIATMIDGEMRVFASSYSRVVYACRNYNVEASTERLCGEFHRRMKDRGQADDIEEYMRAISTLSRIIELISEVKLPDELSGIAIRYLPYSVKSVAGVSVGKKLTGVVDEISAVEYDERGRYYTICLLLEEDTGRSRGIEHKIQLIVRENYSETSRDDLFDIREMLREYDYINVTNVECKEGDIYCATEYSLIILEPDYLVDVTELAACFTSNGFNEYLFLLSKFTTDKDSASLLKGTLVNDVLDASLESEDIELDEVYRHALSKNILKSIRYGGEVIKNIWQEVGRYHWSNIERFASTLRDRRVTVEPSFISPLYGIQGRLDVMVEYDNYPMRKDIYELKSGKAPSGDMLWKGNAMQVACYNMLLESTYGQDRRGTSAVFYSSCAGTPLRNYMSSIEDKKNICLLRNKIVRMVYDMACGDFTVLEKIQIGQIGDYPSYSRERIEDFAKFYEHLYGVRKVYYHSFVSFCLREMICAKTGAMGDVVRDRRDAYSRLWRSSDEEKIHNFAMLPSLVYKGSDKETSSVVFEVKRAVEHSFRAGDVVILYPHTVGERDACHSQVLKGVVRDIDEDRVVVGLRGKIYERYMESRDNWAMEHDVMEKGYWSGVASLKEFVESDGMSSRVVFGEQAPQVGSTSYKWDNRLTDNQNACVEKAVSTADFFLLQGPPGTGKTSGAIMAMVRHVLSVGNDTLTLLAFTNRAVEEIGAKLRAAGIDYLRIGHENADESEQTLSSISAGRKINSVRDIVQSHRVFLSTVSSFAVRAADLASVVKLDQVIVDEASQLTEIQLVGSLAYFKKWILVGDQLQLPSVVVQSESLTMVKDEALHSIAVTDMRHSLFERLQRMLDMKSIDSHSSMLDVHFRMHEDIAALVNDFYDGKLNSGSERQRASSLSPRVLYYPSPHEDSYKKHIAEARRVVELLQEIKQEYGDRFSYATVGVVTPFRAQIAVIKAMIEDKELKEKVLIDTVERFQGGERDIIIASMAVCNAGQMKMVASLDASGRVDRKLNVMVSRSRERFILLGEKEALRGSEFYSELLDKCATM